MPVITNTTTSKAAANIATKEGKTTMVSVPRITFVGGQKLTSTDNKDQEKEEEEKTLKVYPPGASAPKNATAPAAKQGGAEGQKESGAGAEEAGDANSGGGEVEVQLVGMLESTVLFHCIIAPNGESVDESWSLLRRGSGCACEE